MASAAGLRQRDVVLAGVAAFIAWGWLTFYLPSLRYLPQAFLLGCIVAILAVVFLFISTARIPRHDITNTRRHVAFITPRRWPTEKAALQRRLEYQPKDIYPSSHVVSKSFEKLLSLIERDFIETWYGNISKKSTFTNEVDRAIRVALVSMLDQAKEVDIVGVAISRLVPLVTRHMNEAYEAEKAVRGKKMNKDMTDSEELDLAIATKFRNGKLHQAAALTFADTKTAQQQHLRAVILRILPKILPNDMLSSAAVSVLIKEIVSCAVLQPVMQLLCDPDTWNQLLENMGKNILQERKTIRKLRAALDEHAPQAAKTEKLAPFPKLSVTDNDRQFEKFVRIIRQCNNLSDARRFRSEIAGQIVRESAVEDQDPLYLRRLETGKRILDQKIGVMGARGSTPTKSKKSSQTVIKPIVQPQQSKSSLENADLREILYSAPGLSSFMEFMDRQGLMKLVQFWIVVDGFRNPLEGDIEDSTLHRSSKRTWNDADRADIAQINDAYLGLLEVNIDTAAKETVKLYLATGSRAPDTQYYSARKAVLQTQTAVYNKMADPYFKSFRKSDLWYKLLASDAAPPNRPNSTVLPSLETVTIDSISSRPTAPARVSTATNHHRIAELRRAANSTSDLRSGLTTPDAASPTRRSFDVTTRVPLFEDDVDSDALAGSTASLLSDPGSDAGATNGADERVVDKMHLALTDILDDRPRGGSLFPDDGGTKTPLFEDPPPIAAPKEIVRPTSPLSRQQSERPNIASLGLVGDSARRGFLDDNIFGEEEKFLEDEREDSDANDNPADQVQTAAPGDLGLAEAIDALTLDIEKLVSQEAIIDSLTKKAELTNNIAELRILKKSKSSIQREISRKELQRQQYIVQESDNSLYGRATVTIQSIMVGQEEDGKEFALYVVEVRRQAGEQMPSAAWVVARRYSEFHSLNKRLKARYPVIRNLEFPGRQVVLNVLGKDFLQKRRVSLERWLQQLLKVPAICRSREMRAFLSQQTLPSSNAAQNSQIDSRDFVTRIYNSVTDGMEEFLGNIPVLDQLSIAGQNLIFAATSQLNNANNPAMPNLSGSGSAVPSDDLHTTSEAEAEAQSYESLQQASAGSAGLDEPFVKPICDLFLEIFELNRENNWLRGRAVVVVLHQLLGGTIERKVREAAKQQLSEDSIAARINMITGIMWPDGQLRKTPPLRTPAEKAKSRAEAGIVLATLIPELVGSVVGRGNAQAAARRILAAINNRRLLMSLGFELFDEIVAVVFHERMEGLRA